MFVIENSEATQTQDSPDVTKKVRATSAAQIRMMNQDVIGQACMSSATCACHAHAARVAEQQRMHM